MADLESRLHGMEGQIQGFSVANLKEDQDFLDFTREVVIRVAGKSDAERHSILRNALLNTALHNESAEVRTGHYRELLRRFTPTHVRVLKFLHAPPPSASNARIGPREVDHDVARLVSVHVPDLAQQEDLIRVVVRDARSAGLLVFPDYVPPVLGPGQEKIYEMRSSRLSDLGLGFFRFISDPEEAGFQTTKAT
jgi:hypothetical protein